MATPLLSQFGVGEIVDLTTQRLRRRCRQNGDRIELCPHCKRRGMRQELLNGRVRFVHQLQVSEINFVQIDACTMWERQEYRLRYGSDGMHPKYRKPGDEDTDVEEIRPDTYMEHYYLGGE